MTKKIKLLDTSFNGRTEIILTPDEVIELAKSYEELYEETGENIEIKDLRSALVTLTENWHYELIGTV